MSKRDPEAERRALETLDAFTEMLNAQDWVGTAGMINYPHVRIAGGKVAIWNTPSEFARAYPERIGQAFEPGWHHSVFDEREVIHSAADKVHLKVQFTRYDEQGNALATYHSIWIVTLVDGHWGIQARSSFAP